MLFQLLKYLLGSVLDDAERVRISRVETAKVDVFCLTAERGELGRLLGRGGQTAEAIRQVMNAVGARHGKETIIDVVEAHPSQQKARSRRRGRGAERGRPVRRSTPPKRAKEG
jgi:predicted RNA-binding protein YlqC (UPF0109 family)